MLGQTHLEDKEAAVEIYPDTQITLSLSLSTLTKKSSIKSLLHQNPQTIKTPRVCGDKMTI